MRTKTKFMTRRIAVTANAPYSNSPKRLSPAIATSIIPAANGYQSRNHWPYTQLTDKPEFNAVERSATPATPKASQVGQLRLALRRNRTIIAIPLTARKAA